MILLIDNYDSFTFNLFQLLAVCAPAESIRVLRNDALSPPEVARLRPSHVVLSPGPGHPSQAGLSLSLPEVLPATPILGVCLGHQALALSRGAYVQRAPHPTHGRPVLIHHDGAMPFQGLPSPLPAALYHSLVVHTDSLPYDLEVAARSEAGDVMAIRHRRRPHCGVQFHPESFMTAAGPRLIDNFLRRP